VFPFKKVYQAKQRTKGFLME